MKHSSKSGTAALRGGARAFIVVVALGLAVAAAVIFLPHIRASLHGIPPQEPSSSSSGARRSQQSTATLVSGSAIGNAASPSVAAGNSALQEVVTRIKTVTILPVTDYELETIHEQARGEACEAVPAGEALEVASFSPFLTARDYRELGNTNVTALSTRQHVFSVGFDMLASDRSRLPRMSRGLITGYLNGQFITLQVRVQKDLLSGVLHLHHRPLAAVGSFRQRRMTQEPMETLSRSLRNYRSLGLFLEEDMPAIPENLRTLVWLHKSEREASGISSQAAAKYEFVFVRARDDQDGVSARLKCHTFATSDERTRLHYLQPGADPSRAESCSIKTMLHFTEYSDHGLRPVASVSRGSIFNDQASYSLASLNEYAQAQGWAGDALGNLTKTLDAIIDGKVPRQE